MAAAGLVWGQDAWTRPETLASYLHVADAGLLTADLDLAVKVEVGHWTSQIGHFEDARRDAERSAGRRRADGVPGGRLTATTARLFVDGVIEGGTGAVLEPYCAVSDHGAHDHGIAVGQRADLVIVDQDVSVVAPSELPELGVHGTWLAGRRVPTG
jgi:predicted amidohydrolase YtcJ